MADVKITLAAVDQGMKDGLDKAAKSLKSLEKTAAKTEQKTGSFFAGLKGVALPLAALEGGFALAGKAAGAFGDAISEGGRLKDLSAQLSMSIEDLVVLRRAFQNAGSDAESVSATFRKMSDYLFDIGKNSEMVSWFRQFGVDLAELRGKAPIEQFRTFAEVIKSMPEGVDRNKLAMDVFGKSFQEITPLLLQFEEEFAEAKKQLGSTPELYAKNAKLLDNVGDSFSAITAKGKEFALGLLDKVLPTLDKVFGIVAGMDFASAGAKASEYFGKFVGWVTDVTGTATAIDSVKAAIDRMSSGDLGGAFSLLFSQAEVIGKTTINNLYAAATAAVAAAQSVLVAVFSPDGALLMASKSAFEIMAQTMTAKLAGAVAVVAAGLPMGLGKGTAEAMEGAAKQAEKLAGMYAFGFGAQMELVGEQMKEAFSAAPEQFASRYQENLLTPLLKVGEAATKVREEIEKTAGITYGEFTPISEWNNNQGVNGMPARKVTPMPQTSGGGGSSLGIKPSAAMDRATRAGLRNASMFTGLDQGIARSEAAGNFLAADNLRQQKESIAYMPKLRQAQDEVRESLGLLAKPLQNFGDLVDEAWQASGRSNLEPDFWGTGEPAREKADFAAGLWDQIEKTAAGEGTDSPTGTGGKPGEGNPKEGGIEGNVAAIRAAVEKIETKLPQQVLGA